MKTILTTLHSKYIHPSLALPYLASYCDSVQCGTIEICEFTIHEPRDNIIAALLRNTPDVIAFSVYIWNRSAILELVDALHVINPQIRIVLGGPEVSFASTDIMTAHAGVKAIVKGEGEIALSRVLHIWHNDLPSETVSGVIQRHNKRLIDGGSVTTISDLDIIPAPFQNGRMDCNRGFVYYETSRGCPYRCSFCMSALDNQVRSFSMSRIKEDLLWLMEHQIPKIKLVDRTFNYDKQRARQIFAFILQHNISSHFHFEIGAHLLDQETLELLATVPEEMFQFEIGVQSILPATLDKIQRSAPLQQLEENVRFLLRHTNIHIHLDLIGGLPGEDFQQMLNGIDRIMRLNPHHLQIETVKLLPGAPMRAQAKELGIKYDPNPPYRALSTPDMPFDDLEKIRGISRLLDLTWNCGRGRNFITAIGEHYASIAQALATLERFWHREDILRFPLAQREIFANLARFIASEIDKLQQGKLLEILARDYALCERISAKNIPEFYDTKLTEDEHFQVKQHVQAKMAQIKGQGIKLQYFAACFHRLDAGTAGDGRQIRLYYYLTATGKKMCTIEQILPPHPACIQHIRAVP